MIFCSESSTNFGSKRLGVPPPKKIEPILHEYDLVDYELSITGSRAAKKQVPQIKVLPDHRLVMMASLYIKMQGEGEVLPSRVQYKNFDTKAN